MATRGGNGGAIQEFVCQAIPGRPLTGQARQVMTLAHKHAQQLGAPLIEPEHVLLGLVEEGQSVAAQVLRKLGADLKQLQTAVRAISPPAGAGAPSSNARSMDTQRMLMAAQAEKTESQTPNGVDTEHLLVALIELKAGIVPDVLVRCGIQASRIPAEVAALAGHSR